MILVDTLLDVNSVDKTIAVFDSNYDSNFTNF